MSKSAWRARHGSIVRFGQFMKNLEGYVAYGPAGKDARTGAADDLSYTWGSSNIERVTAMTTSALFPVKVARLLLLAAGAVSCLFGTAAADDNLRAYNAQVQAGDVKQACETGAKVLAGIEAAHAGQKAFPASMDARLKAVRNAEGVAVYKFNLIATNAHTEHPSPFTHLTPTPAQFFRQTQLSIANSPISSDALSREEKEFVSSYLAENVLAADREVLSAYTRLRESKVEGEMGANARAYLTAYVVGLHDDDTYPRAIEMLRGVEGGTIPAFLVEDALNQFADAHSAWQACQAIEKALGSNWPSNDKCSMWQRVAAAAEKLHQREWAVMAYSRIASEADPSLREGAQAAVIRIYADDARDYKSAAKACDDYLRLFPGAKDATRIGFMKVLYEYQGEEYDVAFADAQQLRAASPKGPDAPDLAVLGGMCLMQQGKSQGAVDAFADVLKTWPKSRVAGKAQFMMGCAYMQGAKQREALDAFQKVVDFYPNDPNVPQASEYLQKLKGTALPEP